MSRRILVTGSRNWPDLHAVYRALREAVHDQDWDDVVIVHGGCPTGADQFAARWAALVGVKQEVYRADWATHGRAAGPLRNRRMVAAGADLCLAFPLRESRGTRGCMALARSAGIPVKEYTQ
ncbi:MAG: DUF2493 domain-containing protein [Gaiellaceae bacterium]